MADRTSAELFSIIFTTLVEELEPGEKRARIALRFWSLSQSYDFHPMQMGCEDALIALGLARRGVDPDEPNEGETILFGPVKRRAKGNR